MHWRCHIKAPGSKRTQLSCPRKSTHLNRTILSSTQRSKSWSASFRKTAKCYHRPSLDRPRESKNRTAKFSSSWPNLPEVKKNYNQVRRKPKVWETSWLIVYQTAILPSLKTRPNNWRQLKSEKWSSMSTTQIVASVPSSKPICRLSKSKWQPKVNHMSHLRPKPRLYSNKRKMLSGLR